MAHTGVRHHQRRTTPTGRNTNHGAISRGWHVYCKRYSFLTHGGSIADMMELTAYAFPPKPTQSSLSTGAAVYMSPAHADSHNEQRDEAKPPPHPTPAFPAGPQKKTNTPTAAPTPTPTATPTTTTDCTPAFSPYNSRDGSSKLPLWQLRGISCHNGNLAHLFL
jgi:hypothetical protein